MGTYDELSKLKTQSPTREKPKIREKKISDKSKGESKAVIHTKSQSDIMTPRNHETMVSRYHDATVEVVRKAVKDFGKEAATHRFTANEKQSIADIIYTYNTHGIRTSENEITRIAVNFLVNDYKENGEKSILDQVLKALRE